MEAAVISDISSIKKKCFISSVINQLLSVSYSSIVAEDIISLASCKSFLKTSMLTCPMGRSGSGNIPDILSLVITHSIPLVFRTPFAMYAETASG